MKKRNTTIFAFLLLAAVGMGVGYAEFSQNFKINGSFEVNTTQAEKEFQKEIIFTQAEAVVTKINPSESSAEPTKVELDDAKHTVTWTINDLQAKGDKCVGTFTVTNNSDLPAQIEAYAKSDNGNGLFLVTVNNMENGKTLAAKTADDNTDQITFTVTVEMLKDPTSSQAYTFSVGFTASLAQ